MNLKEFEQRILQKDLKLDDATISSYYKYRDDLLIAYQKIVGLSKDANKSAVLPSLILGQILGAMRLTLPKTYESVINMAANYSISSGEGKKKN